MSRPVDHRPTPLGSLLAVLLAGGAVGVLAPAAGQRLPLAGTVLGLACLLVGGRWASLLDGSRVVGLGLAGVGAVVVLASLALAATAPLSAGRRAALLAGLAGVVLVGLGVSPLRGRLARRLLSAGLGALVVAVALDGVFQRTTPLPLLVATAAGVVAWDTGEHAVGLGEQLRTDAATRRVELLHAAGSAGYGAALVGVALLLFERGPTGLPLATLLLVLAGAVVLLAALYR
ncbi:DUF7519 family protein [Haloarcula litorea]|uniref:DUF7519 family protein n=1 Tax=Haloarcula litorea TaxID=3032579 RepID=UPI0023E7A891|nr:hypothetical protein [Halomicroarcula sp. GDY20]